jgi:hypothetical protein
MYEESELKKLKVHDLKQELLSKGLNVTGKKDELIARILATNGVVVPKSPEKPISANSLAAPTPTTNTTLKTPPASTSSIAVSPIVTKSNKTIQKIVSPVEELELTLAAEEAKKLERMQRFGIDVTASSKAKLTEKEKKQSREARFGTGVVAKNVVAHAAKPVTKVAASAIPDATTKKASITKLGFSAEEMEKMKKREERFSFNLSPTTPSPISVAELSTMSETERKRRREEKFAADLASKKPKV